MSDGFGAVLAQHGSLKHVHVEHNNSNCENVRLIMRLMYTDIR